MKGHRGGGLIARLSVAMLHDFTRCGGAGAVGPTAVDVRAGPAMVRTHKVNIVMDGIGRRARVGTESGIVIEMLEIKE